MRRRENVLARLGEQPVSVGGTGLNQRRKERGETSRVREAIHRARSHMRRTRMRDTRIKTKDINARLPVTSKIRKLNPDYLKLTFPQGTSHIFNYNFQYLLKIKLTKICILYR